MSAMESEPQLAVYGSTDEDWTIFSLCKNVGTELFYAPDSVDARTLSGSYYDEGKKLCALCPVRLMCLEAGLKEEFGVWGGMTHPERVREVARRERAAQRQAAGKILPNKIRRKGKRILNVSTETPEVTVETNNSLATLHAGQR